MSKAIAAARHAASIWGGLSPQAASAHFGPYELIRVLGAGGMGVVYLARHQSGGATSYVAVKRLHGYFAEDEEHRRMFMREAEILSSFDHPNVQRLCAHGEVDGELFIATDFLAGATWAELTAKLRAEDQELRAKTAAAVLIQVLDGLAYVHGLRDVSGRALGVAHRDLKPANIFVTEDGTVKLIDFGIARTAEQTRVTPDGFAKGSIAYVAPEQLQQWPKLDDRADVFSFGAIAWEAFSGAPLFMRKTFAETAAAVLAWRIPPVPIAGDPGAISDLIHRALDRDPAQRPSVEELRDAFVEIFEKDHLAEAAALGYLVRELFPERTYEQQIAGSFASEDITDPEERPRAAETIPLPVLAEVSPVIASPKIEIERKSVRWSRWWTWFAAVFISVAFFEIVALAYLVGWSEGRTATRNEIQR